MPCDSSHLEADGREVESSKVREFLREVTGKPFNHRRRAEYYGNVKTLDADTAELCGICQTVDVSRFSLELQLWWRDHQEADAKKAADVKRQAEEAEARDRALRKLSDAERALLGVR